MLLRLSNLGYQNHAMTLDNVDMTVVAKDASLLRGRDGSTNYQVTNTVDVGPGESRDVLVTPAPSPASTCSTTATTPTWATAAGPAGAA